MPKITSFYCISTSTVYWLSSPPCTVVVVIISKNADFVVYCTHMTVFCALLIVNLVVIVMPPLPYFRYCYRRQCFFSPFSSLYCKFGRYCTSVMVFVIVPHRSKSSKVCVFCCLLYQYTYACILCYSCPSARRQRYSCHSARRQRWFPSLPCTVVVVVIASTLFRGRISSIKYIKNICICRLLYQYSTLTVLYYILCYACSSARLQRLLPLPPRNVTVVVLIAAAYQRTFNNRELFLLLFTTNLFGLAIQRRVSSKQVVPARKKQREQGKTKE